MIIKESIKINNTLNNVYQIFADPMRWCQILPDVSDVQIHYNDGRHQEFTMSVDKPTGTEQARAIRYCLGDRILVFQPEPPPGVKALQAEWNFEKDSDQTKVVAIRNLQLEDIDDENNMTPNESERYKDFKTNVSALLRKNLNAFKAQLEQLTKP